MRSEPPVILLAFANERQDGVRYLRAIPEEMRAIRASLEAAVARGWCEVEVLPNVTPQELFDAFQNNRLRGRIAVFHYGGHAGSYELLLEASSRSNQVISGKGLAPFLGSQKGLQLIFLNGCSTEQQALYLNDSGIPMVIGTFEAIRDEAACRIAERFYNGLGQGLPVRQSWDQALQFVRSTAGDNLRSIGRPEMNLDRFPWSVFTKKGAEVAADWNLPDAANDPLGAIPLPFGRYPLPEMPFRLLDRYKQEDAPVYFGRGHYIREIYNQLTNPLGSPVIRLCGQSGVGKSSLLEAGVLPRLEDKCVVRYLRRDPDLGLSGTLTAALQTEDGVTADNLPGLWKAIEARHQKPLVIILDQLEEVFTRRGRQESGEMEAFAQALHRIFHQPAERPAGKILLSFRKEFAEEVEKALKTCQVPRAAAIFLEKMTRAEVIEVVNGLASTASLREQYGLQIEQGLPEIIATDLLTDSDTAVAPILQIILTKLWQGLSPNEESRIFTVHHYLALKENGVYLGDFFRQQMEQLRLWEQPLNNRAESSGLALDMLSEHVTELGYSNSRSLEDLRRLYAHRAEVLDGLLAKFKELYLLTDTGKDSNALAHDTLAPVIQQEARMSLRPGQKARRILAGKTAVYQRNPEQTFLDEEDLAIVDQGTDGMRILMPLERELVDKSRDRCRRQRLYRRIMMACIGILLAAVIWLGWAFSKKYRIEYRVAQARLEAGTDPVIALQTLRHALDIDSQNPAALAALADIYSDNEFYEHIFPHPKPVRGVATSSGAQGNFIVSWTDRMIFRWHTDGRLLDTLPVEGLIAAALSPDGKLLIASTWAGDLLCLETAGLRQVQKATLRPGYGITHLVFSPDGRILYAGGNDQLAILDPGNLHQPAVWFRLDTTLSALRYHPYHHTFLLGFADGHIEERTPAGAMIQTFRGHSDQVLALAVSPRDSSLASGGRDAVIALWNPAGELKLKIKAHDLRVNALAWTPDGQRLLSASTDHLIKCWSPEGNWVTTYKGHTGFVNALALTADGRAFVSAGEDNAVRLWKTESKVIRHFGGHPDGVSEAVFAAGESVVLTGSDAGQNDAGEKLNDPGYGLRLLLDAMFKLEPRSAFVWDAASGGKALELKGHAGGINAVAANRAGTRYATASDDKSVVLWDRQGQALTTLSGGHHRKVLDVVFSPDDRYILSAGYDSAVVLWDAAGRILQTIPHPAVVATVAWAPDGRVFATGAYDGRIRVFDAEGHPQQVIGRAGDFRIQALDFSPDGRQLLVGQTDNLVRLYDLKGKMTFETQVLTENKTGGATIHSVAFSPDGRSFCVGAEGGLAQVFRLSGGQSLPVERLQHYPARAVTSVRFSADGKQVLTGSADGWARLWRLSE